MVRFYPFSANDHILCVKLCQNSVQILKILSSGNSLSYTKYYNPVLINSIIIGLLGSLSILHISSNHFIWVVNNPVKKRAKFWQRSSNRTKFCLKFYKTFSLSSIRELSFGNIFFISSISFIYKNSNFSFIF